MDSEVNEDVVVDVNNVNHCILFASCLFQLFFFPFASPCISFSF